MPQPGQPQRAVSSFTLLGNFIGLPASRATTSLIRIDECRRRGGIVAAKILRILLGESVASEATSR
jgi:hypothetical protein